MTLQKKFKFRKITDPFQYKCDFCPPHIFWRKNDITQISSANICEYHRIKRTIEEYQKFMKQDDIKKIIKKVDEQIAKDWEGINVFNHYSDVEEYPF